MTHSMELLDHETLSIQTGKAAKAEQTRRAALQQHLEEITPVVTAQEIEVIKIWQKSDRFYSRLQQLLRVGGTATPDEAVIISTLSRLVHRQQTVKPGIYWRGVRNCAVIGLSINEITFGDTFLDEGFVSLSASAAVSLQEFTHPPLGAGPVLLRVYVPMGVYALPLQLIGDPKMAYQGEVLLQRVQFQVTAAKVEILPNTPPIIEVEVIANGF